MWKNFWIYSGLPRENAYKAIKAFSLGSNVCASALLK